MKTDILIILLSLISYQVNAQVQLKKLDTSKIDISRLEINNVTKENIALNGWCKTYLDKDFNKTGKKNYKYYLIGNYFDGSFISKEFYYNKQDKLFRIGYFDTLSVNNKFYVINLKKKIIYSSHIVDPNEDNERILNSTYYYPNGKIYKYFDFNDTISKAVFFDSQGDTSEYSLITFYQEGGSEGFSFKYSKNKTIKKTTSFKDSLIIDKKYKNGQLIHSKIKKR